MLWLLCLYMTGRRPICTFCGVWVYICSEFVCWCVCAPCASVANKNNGLENSPFPWWITLNWVETRMERGWRKSWREWEREKVCSGLKCSYRVGIKKKRLSTIFIRSLTRGDVHLNATSASSALSWGTSQTSPNLPITCPESLWPCRLLPALSGHG